MAKRSAAPGAGALETPLQAGLPCPELQLTQTRVAIVGPSRRQGGNQFHRPTAAPIHFPAIRRHNMKVGDFVLGLLVDGDLVAEFWDTETETSWIAAERGKEFSLLLINDGDARVVAIPSVDGLSVMDGEPASYESAGYLVHPHSQVVVPGWRLDNGSVAQFQFGAAAQGYARQAGHSPRNVGVIAAAFFREKPRDHRQDDGRRPNQLPRSRRGGCLFGWITDLGRSSDSGMQRAINTPKTKSSEVKFSVRSLRDPDPPALAQRPTTQAPTPAVTPLPSLPPLPSAISEALFDQEDTDDVAVVFGRKVEHRVREVQLERASSTPDAVISIRYDTRHGLESRKIGCRIPPGWHA